MLLETEKIELLYLSFKNFTKESVNQDLQDTLGANASTCPTVLAWCVKLKRTKTSTNDHPRSDRPTTVVTEEMQKGVHDRISRWSYCYKRRGKLAKSVLFYKDNASARRSAVAMAAIRDVDFKIFDHVLYSLNFAHSDFYVFPKEYLKGQRFEDDETVQVATVQDSRAAQVSSGRCGKTDIAGGGGSVVECVAFGPRGAGFDPGRGQND
ncbi:hypothetical protein EVAR_88401_1 [Eumeta japonica]|uniref:Mos1 transposase HTH domain-containing protein n=1 Tax=Eumeta variegata TaxID=151549 RepID=A0A4C1YU90_EUMVA|nr:hypothetical protein EVAR_88401_1 [Eumeta japonica]